MSRPIIPDRDSSLNQHSSVSLDPTTTLAIPKRSSSKRKVSATASQYRSERDAVTDTIKKQRKQLKPSSSYDSNFWSSKADLLSLDHKRLDLNRMAEFHEYLENGGTLSYSEWENSTPTALELRREMHALQQKKQIAEHQAEKLRKTTHSKGLLQAFVKLFNSSKLGFNINTTGQGRRTTDNQSKMRSSMVKDYCNGKKTSVWEPVLGMWVHPQLTVAAHLFPWHSADMMDQIFGQGAVEEVFSSLNGLFLCREIESALEKGYIAITPDQDLEPEDLSPPEADREARRQRLKEWERSSPKEYKVVVLDSSPKIMQEAVFDQTNLGYPVSRLAELHGRRLNFLNDFRPRSRYVWWTYLHAITQISWREKNTIESAIPKEVAKGTRYWGTRGRYVKKNMLLGFIQEIGHDVESIRRNHQGACN
jgi:hypothetical protein